MRMHVGVNVAILEFNFWLVFVLKNNSLSAPITKIKHRENLSPKMSYYTQGRKHIINTLNK